MNLTRLGMAAMAVAVPLTLLPLSGHGAGGLPSVAPHKSVERGGVAKDRAAQCRMPTAIRYGSAVPQRFTAVTPMSHAGHSVTQSNGNGADIGTKVRRVCHRSHRL